MVSVQEAIAKRRSIRSYKEIPVEQDKWGKLLLAANYAPSAGNLGNWRIIVIQEKSTIEKIAHLCHRQAWMTTAPLLLVFCADVAHMDRFYKGHGEHYSSQGCAAAIQNVLLAAHDMELAGCWVGAYDKASLRTLLGVPEHADVFGVVTVGYPNEQVPTPQKQPLKRYAFLEKYGNQFADIDVVFGNVSSLVKKRAAESKGFLYDLISRLRNSLKK